MPLKRSIENKTRLQRLGQTDHANSHFTAQNKARLFNGDTCNEPQ